MRRSFIYSVLAAVTAVAAISCVEPVSPVFPEGDFTGIRLTPIVDGVPVKSTTEAGDDTYNENLISNYCWFIYSDEAGTSPLLCGMETGSDPRTIVLDSVLGSGYSGGTAYVFVIANLPSPYTFNTDDGIVNSETSAVVGKTLSALKAMGFESAFYNYTSATTGVPAPSNFVMRTENPVAFTLETNVTTSVTASLKRVAAKIILDLQVAKEVKQMTTNAAGAELYKKTWQADIEHIQVYMLWGSTHGDIAGTKLDYKTAADPSAWFYSASPRYAMYTNPEGGSYNASTNTVEGKVPSSRYREEVIAVSSSEWQLVYEINVDANGEPIWIWRSGVPDSDKTDAHIGNLQYGDWDFKWGVWHWNSGVPLEEQTEENKGDNTYGYWEIVTDSSVTNSEKIPLLDAEGKHQYKLGTSVLDKMYYFISSLPMYSMPIQWNVNDAHAPFIKVILPWQGCIRSNDGDGDITSSDPKTTEFYYKILVPKRTTLDANGCYHISLDLSVLGSEADEVPVALSGEYHVVDWNASESMGGLQSAGRYLDCKTYFEFYSQNEMNIPISSSHDIEVVNPSATYTDYSSTNSPLPSVSLTYSTTSSNGQYYKVTPVSNSKVTVSHNLVTNISSMQVQDIAPITYTFRIQHKDDDSFYKDITVVQYPSLYIQNYLNTNYTLGSSDYNSYKGYVYINGQTSPSKGSTSNLATDWYYWSGISSYSYETGNNNPNMYSITTKVIDSSLGFEIGDPRTGTVSIPTDPSSYVIFNTAPSVEGGTRSLTNYYPTENSAQTANMISPAFRTASSYGKCGFGFGYDYAVARCAAYQEDGYPAGRWRVPTKAEIEYLTTLSANSLIPQLYNTVEDSETSNVGHLYWSANGMIRAHASGNAELLNTDAGGYVVGNDVETIKIDNNDFTIGSGYGTYKGYYKDVLGIQFEGNSTSYSSNVVFTSSNYTYVTVTGTNISKIVIDWFYYKADTPYYAYPDAVSVYSGGGTVSTDTSNKRTTWTSSTPVSTVILRFYDNSQYYYCPIRIAVKADYQINVNEAFVRCVYDDWYWGSERPLGSGSTTFTWGDKAR